VKGEAAALTGRAQRCPFHYFSTAPRIIKCLELYCCEQCSGFNLANHKTSMLATFRMKFTRIFILCHKTLGFTTHKILVLFGFNTDATICQQEIKAEKMPIKWNTFISSPQIMLQLWLKMFRKSQKIILQIVETLKRC
jgi:hypothetical protein